MTDIYRIQKRKRLFNFNTTIILIAINVVIFLLALIFQQIYPNFIDYIALKPSNIISNLYIWTFLTSMFMHAGFFHLFVNMFSLLFVGNLVERIIGKKRFISFYLLAGLFAGMLFVLISWIMKTYFAFSGDFNTFAVGASGAIFGIIGLLMVLTPNLPVYMMFIPIPIKMKYAAPAMLVLLWIVSSLGNISIGNTAHLGGFIVGLIYGIYLRRKYKKKTKYISKLFS